MVIYTIHQYDEEHLAQVMDIAQKIGSVTIKAFCSDGAVYTLEGVHRVEAAKRLKLPLYIVSCEWDAPIEHDLQDVDFDATVGDVYDYAYGSSLDGSVYDEDDFENVEIL